MARSARRRRSRTAARAVKLLFATLIEELKVDGQKQLK